LLISDLIVHVKTIISIGTNKSEISNHKSAIDKLGFAKFVIIGYNLFDTMFGK